MNGLGDAPFSTATTIPRESDGQGSAGDVVTYDDQGRVTPVTAAGDVMIGVLAMDAPDAGENVSVHANRPAFANTDGSVAAGVLVEPSGNAGEVTSGTATTAQAIVAHTAAGEDATGASTEETTAALIGPF